MHGDNWLILIAILILLALVVAPILAIAAWIRVRRIEQSRPQVPAESYFSALTARIFQLEKKAEQLEQRIAELSAVGVARPAVPVAGPSQPAPDDPSRPAAAPPSPVPPLQPTRIAPEMGAPVAPSSRPVLSAPAFSSAPMDKPELESVIAGRWLNRVGIASVIIAVAYFLKYAFDNAWIGPTGQVALGILFGSALLVFAHWLLGRGYLYFSEGIDGLGASVLYLSLWAACSYYTPPILSRDVAFVAMIFVSAAMLAIALGRDSQRVAGLGLAGGFITPMLVSTGQDAQVALFSYMMVLNAGLLVFAHLRAWRWLEGPAFFFTTVYFWGWYARFYNADKLLITCFFATLFFALFSAAPVIRARRTGTLHAEQALLVLLNGGIFLLALQVLLWRDHRWPLTFAVLALAAMHLIILRALPPPRAGEPPLARLLFAGLALTFVTLVIPIRLDGKWITLAWALEGAILMWTGFRTRQWYLRGAAFALFTVVAMRLLTMPDYSGTAFYNERFATYLVTLACIGASLYLWYQNKDKVAPNEDALFRMLGIGFNVLALVALTMEMGTAFRPDGGYGWEYDARLKYGLSISLTWTVYAVGLLFLGIRWASAGMRWQALALLGAVVLKVFLVDLSSLRGIYRVVSFIVLGVVLLVVSFFYQKKLAEKKSAGS